MATVKSTQITNATATPKVLNNSNVSVGEMKESIGVATVSATQASGDIIRFCRVPSNARISEVLLSTGDATLAGNIDIGVYQTDDNGGAVVDADLFASALALTGGPFQNSDQTFESGQYTYAESAQPLWQVLGLSADSNREYDICATVTTTFDGADTTQVLKVRYAI